MDWFLYDNQSTDLLRKSMDLFLRNNGLRHERVNGKLHFLCSVENKFKKVLRKIKTKLPQQDFIKLYPTGSAPGKFYRTAKKNIKYRKMEQWKISLYALSI